MGDMINTPCKPSSWTTYGGALNFIEFQIQAPYNNFLFFGNAWVNDHLVTQIFEKDHSQHFLIIIFCNKRPTNLNAIFIIFQLVL